MIYCPDKYIKKIKDVNAELMEMKGFESFSMAALAR
jgi:hypothetical protein